ncbi:TetR/AcrR family transcriptional regulator [Nocardia jiangxiensis]|uniref:TetR/AcrR family transcriptional regulator n=1 Tax=Nocardia jiangxiensis TaxID=282685 RepID=A0ABW6S9I7_9NOCA
MNRVSRSLRGLARELGVSHGAPNKHFADKQALLDALARYGLEQLGVELDTGLACATGGFEQRLTVFADVCVRFPSRSPNEQVSVREGTATSSQGKPLSSHARTVTRWEASHE